MKHRLDLRRIVASGVSAAMVFLLLNAAAPAAAQGHRLLSPPSKVPSANWAVLSAHARAALAELLKGGSFTVDVAENGTRFVPDETPVFADGLPAYGAEFITEGYIYPKGTLSSTNGVHPDGSPEFPEKVIGRWVCRGWHVGDGAHTEEGPWVVTHQLFSFTLGSRTDPIVITTDGFELPEVDVAIKRAITGGTGVFSFTRGEGVQTFLGWNQSVGTNSRHEFKVHGQ